MNRALILGLLGSTVLGTLLGTLLGGCTAVVWRGHDPARTQPLRIVETACGQRLWQGEQAGPIFDGIAADGLVFDANGRPVYPAEIDDGWAVVRDGRPGKVWQALGPLIIDPDGEPAYAARDAAGWRVVTAAGEGPPLAGIYGPLRYAGARLIYVGGTAEGQRVFVDHRPGPPLDAVRQIRTGGGRVAAFGRRGEDEVVLVDGAEHGRFAEVADVQLDRHHVAVTARRDGHWHVVLDGAWSPGHAVISRVHLADGRVLYATGDADGQRAWLDGAPGPLYAAVHMVDLRLDPGGPTYSAREPARSTSTGRHHPWTLVLDGAPILTADDLGRLTRIPGGHWAIAARRANALHLVRDGAWGPAYHALGRPVLSPDGAHVAALADGGQTRGLLFDGRITPVEDPLDGTVAISRDGRRAGCVGRDGERWVFAFSDGTRRPFDLDELIAALTVTPAAQRPLDPDVAGILLHWVRIELERADR